ncbi:LamG-like jellyroll fold domain-containing protein [Streptomyces sp. NBC_00872]|uniref:LamG-like jellyroll fold domain-containing protein n=1 Tax=Streptomyces sp. NBC_00872 TaxID=2903686 RepID=UPI00386B2190|nr:polymorphic toxin-type HINT domain-containing protein [Streptomyces sp. NBC_00872]
MTATVLVAALSTVMSTAHAVPTATRNATADEQQPPGQPVKGELAHFDFEYSQPDFTDSALGLEGGAVATHHNGIYAGERTDNEVIWGDLASGGRTLRLDGVDDYLSVPVRLPTDQSFTVSTWLRSEKAGQAATVISEPGSQVPGFALKVNADGKPSFGMPKTDSATAVWDTVTGTAPVANPANGSAAGNDWTHLTGVFDAGAGEIRLYVNGARVAVAPHAPGWKATADVEVGRGLAAGQPGGYFAGRMDEVRIWNRALPDLEASNTAISADQARADRCESGNWLHAGGPKVKAAAAQGLTGPAVNARLAVYTWGFGALDTARRDDHNDQLAARNAQVARETAWAAITTPFAVHNDEYTTFLHAPEYGKSMRDFLLDDAAKNFDGPPLPKPSQAALDRAIAILKERQEETKNEPWGGVYGFYMSEDDLRKMSSYEIARFIRLGGLPSASPEKDSLEFRMEVEELKTQWAGCATSDPFDPLKQFGDVVETADAEWQAEQASQTKQRGDLVAAEIQSYKDLRTASNAMIEAQGQAYIVSRMLVFQKYWQGKPKTEPGYPKATVFTQATTAITNAKKAISAQLTIAQQAAASAKTQSDRAAAAQDEAGKIALANGTPYGRGLTYAQQSAQVAKASALAAQSSAKAVEATLSAVSATAADSKALYALGDTQSHATQTAFQRAAAEEAAAQAKAAADAAALQATQAAENATKAKAARAKAETAEQTAKTAAADAKAKRAVAEAERDKAKIQKDIAASERTKAADAEQRARTQREAAGRALNAAQAAGTTASAKKEEALAAEREAEKARDGALRAESDRDTALAKQWALEAKADADEGTAAAEASRAAAVQARTAADQATTAAANARAAANTATTAAANAREAATKAEAAAARSKAASDAAQRDVAITNAAVATAHSAAADAIASSEAAAQNVRAAQALADTAKAKAAEAKAHAAIAQIEAKATAAAAVLTAGHAYAAAQSATAARDAATAAAAAADNAISLGTPFREIDSSAGLAVLVGQTAKTLAQQQAAVAQARADEAAKAAATAKALAAKASADNKAAATAASQAADSAVRATASVNKARASAAEAAAAVKATLAAEANTVEYDRQATGDAAEAAEAASTASTYATDARNSADAAEQDAASARSAASAAEGDAATARSAADRAEADAAEAEAAAARAQEAARDAQEAATRTENTKARETVTTGGATGIGQVFTKQTIEQLGEPTPENDCVLDVGFDGCTVTFKLRFNVTVDFYLCQDADADTDVTAATCPADSILWLGSEKHENQTASIDRYFSRLEITLIFDKMFLQTLWTILTDDFVQCSKGSVSGCLWAASNFIPGKKIADAVDAIRALDVAMATGTGVGDAYRVLKNLDLDPRVVATIEREVNVLEDALTACNANSFPTGTQVLMADGSHKAINEVREGDLLLAGDPATGELRSEAVTDTYQHPTGRLIDITLAGGSTLTSTAGHKVYAVGRGWTLVSDLRAGDRLRGPDGSARAVTALRDRSGLTPRTVYDLTVDDLHTFYVSTVGTRPQDVLVHNCLNLKLHEGDRGAHTIEDHVDTTPEKAIKKAQDELAKNPNSSGVTGVWTDLATAQRAVDDAFAKWLTGMSPKQNKANQRKLKNWMERTSNKSESPTDLLPFEVTLDDTSSLGTIWKHDRTSRAAGNTVAILLKRSAHKPGYMVYTAYPK